jgi:hypothetical protein
MIIYKGIENKNNVKFLLFEMNDKKISIPIDSLTADRITKYLSKLIHKPNQLEHYVEEQDE